MPVMMVSRARSIAVLSVLQSIGARSMPSMHAAFIPSPNVDSIQSSNLFFTFARRSRPPLAIRVSSTDSRGASDLPTVKELSTDSFMTQVSHASKLVQSLQTYASNEGGEEEDNAVAEYRLTDLLTAQLSHSDGIRGFFATYLTGEGETVADKEKVPIPLRHAMARADSSDLIPLACKLREDENK